MPAKPIPDGYDSLIPYLVVRDAARAIDFYKDLFGATELLRMNYPDGSKIMHAEIKIRSHVLMLSDENPQFGTMSPLSLSGPSPVTVMIYVTDVDAVFNKAVSLGAKPHMPPMEMFWGDRFAKFADPFGHLWSIATHLRDVSPEEMAQAAAQAFAQKPDYAPKS
jgi:PhnB protein